MLALASGCVEEATDDVSVAESDQPSFVLLGNIYQNGTKVSFENITRISGFDPWAHLEWDTGSGYGFNGLGAWSVNLFKPGSACLH